MQTKLYIYRPGATGPEAKEVNLPPDGGYGELKEILTPLLDGGRLEHVSVLFNGKAADMFVDDIGVLKGLPRNDAATEIYRTNSMKWNPDQDPESLPAIHGPAVVFDKPVWL